MVPAASTKAAGAELEGSALAQELLGAESTVKEEGAAGASRGCGVMQPVPPKLEPTSPASIRRARLGTSAQEGG